MSSDQNTKYDCQRCKTIFDNSPFALWLEDMSEFKSKIDTIKNEIGIEKMRERLNDMNLIKDLIMSIKIIKINTKTLQLHGAKLESDLSFFLQTFTDVSIETFKNEIMAIANEEKLFCQETQIKKLNGELLDIIISMSFPDKIEEYNHIMVSFTDITKIKKLEREIIKNRDSALNNLNKFKSLIQTTKIAYIILLEDGTIKEVNETFLEIIGCTNPEKVIGIKIQDLISKEDCQKITKALSKINNGIPIEEMEVCLENSFLMKKNIWIKIDANSMDNEDKIIFCLIKNITSKKIEEIKKYINNEKQKDKVKQNISKIRNKLQNMRDGREGKKERP